MIAVSIPLQWWSPLKQIVTLKYYHFNALEWTVSSPCQSQRFSFPISQFFVQTSADSKDLLSFKEKKLCKPCPSFSPGNYHSKYFICCVFSSASCLPSHNVYSSICLSIICTHTRIKCVCQSGHDSDGWKKWKMKKDEKYPFAQKPCHTAPSHMVYLVGLLQSLDIMCIPSVPISALMFVPFFLLLCCLS